jgi:hypothetical protein
MPRVKNPVRIDGVLEEWIGPASEQSTVQGRASLVRRSLQDVYPLQSRHPVGGRAIWQGPDDLSVRAWWGWDGEALCVAAEVTDDRHFNTKTGDMIWNGDALQVGLVTTNNTEWNLGLALTTNGAAFHQFAGPGDALAKTAQYAVVRDDPAVGGTSTAKLTRYELRLPLADLGLTPGAEFGFNVAFLDDDDGSGSRYWFQLASGLCGRTAKTAPPAKSYPRFVMEK